MATSSELRKVERAASLRARAETAFREAVVEAHLAGESLRTIAKAAGLSHTRIVQIVRGE